MGNGYSVYPWSIAVWRQHPAYIELMPREQGMLRNLMDEAMLRGGSLPDDERLLSRACGDPIEWPDARDKVMGCFYKTDDGRWTNGLVKSAIAELEQIGLQDALRGQRLDKRRERRRTPVDPTTGMSIGRRKTDHPPLQPPNVSVVGSNTDPTNERLLEPINLYNRVFGTEIGPTPGNLRASARAFAFGYTLENMETVFNAVKNKLTDAAKWCADHNREFEYLIRPEHKNHRSKELVAGRIDVILNELATGRKPTLRLL